MKGKNTRALTMALILPLAAGLAACNGGGGGDKDQDVQEDQPPDTIGEDMAADPVGEDPGRDDSVEEEAAGDVLVEDVPEEEVPPAMTPEEYCAGQFIPICSYVSLCCLEEETQLLETEGLYDPDACTAPTTMEDYFECVARLRPSFDAGRITFDEAAAASCDVTVEDFVESCPNLSLFVFDSARIIRHDEECTHIWHGNVALDGECVIDQDCTDGWCNEGRCAPLKDLYDECVGNQECGLHYSCISGHCYLLGQNGEECDTLDGYDCAVGLYCAENICLYMIDSGEDCTIGQDVCKGVCVEFIQSACSDFCNGI